MKFGIGVYGIIAVQFFEFFDGYLSRRGSGFFVGDGESNEGVEFFCDDSGDESGFAHAEDDSFAACFMEQVESIEAIVDVVGFVDQLGNCDGVYGLDMTMEFYDIIEFAFEVMSRED